MLGIQIILAAGEAPAFFGQVAALLIASAAISYVCYRFGVTPIVSFLLTGALIGPHALGLVRSDALIEAAAEVGVILLLFTIGIEFSLEKLSRIKRLIFIGGGLQVGLVVALVTGLLALFGVGWRTGVFTGCLVALSSTAIVMKLLMSRSETDTTGGRAALGVLIFQDLAVVAMVLFVPILGGEGGAPLEIVWALGKAAGIIVLVLVVARRVMPVVLEAVARTCSQEIFVLAIVAICFGTAYLTSLAGVSLSLGAFLAGLVVSESRFSELAMGEILPFQILFSAAFFVSVGLLLDVGFLLSNLPLVLALVAGVLLIKVLSTGISVRALGYGLGTVSFSSLMLAQVGEFSFVLERAGREVGLFPAGLEAGGPQAFIAATVILMVVTPFLAQLGAALEARWLRRTDAAHPAAEAMAMQEVEAEAFADVRDHVILAGYGATARALGRVLAEEAIPHVVITLSPDGAREAEARGLQVLRGNYLRQHELSLAGIDRARLLVVADDDLETTHRAVAAIRALNPDVPLFARTRFASERRGLQEAGAAVVAEEQEAVIRLLTEVLDAYDRPEEALEHYQDVLRADSKDVVSSSSDGETKPVKLSAGQADSPRCTHTNLAQEVVPGATGCEECLKTGDTWVHLRVCMTCGHVGCCDSSKNKHATKHARAAGHPIVKSLEPGEDWAWCYVDETML